MLLQSDAIVEFFFSSNWIAVKCFRIANIFPIHLSLAMKSIWKKKLLYRFMVLWLSLKIYQKICLHKTNKISSISNHRPQIPIHFLNQTNHSRNWDTLQAENTPMNAFNTTGTTNKLEKKTLLFIFHFGFVFIFSFISCRETDVKGLTAFSKCQMYDVNWTTIQSWDYENWNSTRHQEKRNVLGKYWQVTKLNKRKRKKKKRKAEKENNDFNNNTNRFKLEKITFTLLSSHCTLHWNNTE